MGMRDRYRAHGLFDFYSPLLCRSIVEPDLPQLTHIQVHTEMQPEPLNRLGVTPRQRSVLKPNIPHPPLRDVFFSREILLFKLPPRIGKMGLSKHTQAGG